MVVWIMLVAVGSGLLASVSAILAGLPWWTLLLAYPLVGTLGALLAGMALFVCRGRAQAPAGHPRH